MDVDDTIKWLACPMIPPLHSLTTGSANMMALLEYPRLLIIVNAYFTALRICLEFDVHSHLLIIPRHFGIKIV